MGFPAPLSLAQPRRQPKSRCYTSGRMGRPTRVHRGGATIAEVLRRAWSRLGRKQWLICYPLALAVINTLAFLAVYSAGGESVRLSAFFTADFERAQYAYDHFFTNFAFTPALAVAVFAGFAVCIFAAMIRAPYFRAISGPTYPLAPRKWEEAGNLFLYYLFANLILWVIPLPAPTEGLIGGLVAMLELVVLILIVFADYVIVFEGLSFLPALRRSVQLLRHRWAIVLFILVVLDLVQVGLHSLYGLYYHDGGKVFILLPISHILVQSFVVLFTDLILIFLYEDIRRSSPA
jgi:hypothetical protein